jgi:hypothetical protein
LEAKGENTAMSSLEDKAFWVKVPIIGGNPNVQVVTLEFAQKEIEKKQRMIDSLKKMVEVQSQIKREAVDVAVNLEAKVETAKQELDKLIRRRKAITNDDLKHLRSVLIPRNDEQKSYGCCTAPPHDCEICPDKPRSRPYEEIAKECGLRSQESAKRSMIGCLPQKVPACPELKEQTEAEK